MRYALPVEIPAHKELINRYCFGVCGKISIACIDINGAGIGWICEHDKCSYEEKSLPVSGDLTLRKLKLVMIQKLVRKYKQSIRLDFTIPVRCICGKSDLVVIDHRSPRYRPATTLDWRYEVTCDVCLWCDANGYRTKFALIARYPGGNWRKDE